MSKASELARQRAITDVQRVPTIQPVQAINRAKQQAGMPTAPIDAQSPNGVAQTTASQTQLAAESGMPLAGLPQATLELLTNAGFENAEQVRGASDKELLDINGIGPKGLADIRALYPAQDSRGD